MFAWLSPVCPPLLSWVPSCKILLLHRKFTLLESKLPYASTSQCHRCSLPGQHAARGTQCRDPLKPLDGHVGVHPLGSGGGPTTQRRSTGTSLDPPRLVESFRYNNSRCAMSIPGAESPRRDSTASVTIFGHTHGPARAPRRSTADSQKQDWDSRTKVFPSAAAPVCVIKHRLGPQ